MNAALALLLLFSQPEPTPTPTPADAPTPAPAAADTPAPTDTPATDAQADTAAQPDAPEAAPAEPPPALVPPGHIQVEVIALRPNGQITPAHAEVRLERRRQTPGSAPATAHLALAMTNAEGLAIFPPIGPVGMGESDRVIARYHGHEVVAALSAERDGITAPVRLVVREVSRDLSPLRLDVRIGLTPLDTVLRLEHFIRFENPTHTVLDTDQAQGVRVPLLLPSPFGGPARGLFPGRPDPNELIQQINPDMGRLVVEGGDLVYRGPIPPEGLSLRIIMAIPYDGSTEHRLALSSPVDLSDLTFIAQSPPNVGLMLATDRPTQLLTRTSQGGLEQTLTVLEAPKAGDALTLTVSNTPDRHGLMRPLAAGLGLAIVAALLVLLAAPRGAKRQRPEPAAPPSP